MSHFPPNLFKGARFAVLGLGRNGAAVVTALLAMGAHVQAWDDRAPALPAHDRLTVAPLVTLEGFDALVMSPGIPHLLPKPHPVADLARQSNTPILSDAELLYRAVRKSGSKARFASITGTNGKSTTTALLAHILQTAGFPTAAGGNLGAASLSLPLLPDTGVYVIEMSSYMLERLDSFHADTAVLLNLTPDHLDRHGDMDGYARAKAHVFDHMTPDDLALIAGNDPWSDALAARIPALRLTETDCRNGKILWQTETLADLATAPALPGSHNTQNAVAACFMARHLGASPEQIAHGVSTFPGLAHRQKRIGTLAGVTFVDDSKATNADAAARALGCYESLVWIAGGIAKAGGIEDLAPWFPRITHAYLIGQDAPLLAKTLSENGVAFDIVETLDHAVPAAFTFARQHGSETVLLSPACASFDQFSSFEARGSHFLHLFNNLIETDSSKTTPPNPTPPKG